jgi:hypothetical protein
VRGLIIIKRIFRKQYVRRGLDLSGLGQRHVSGSCERGDEHADYIKCGEFFD